MPRRRLFLTLLAALVGTAALGWFIVTRESPDLQRFRQIEVGMRLEDVKQLFPEQVPATGGPIRREPDWFRWAHNGEAVMVHVDERRRVTGATYTRVTVFDELLYEAADWVGISYSPGRTITMP